LFSNHISIRQELVRLRSQAPPPQTYKDVIPSDEVLENVATIVPDDNNDSTTRLESKSESNNDDDDDDAMQVADDEDTTDAVSTTTTDASSENTTNSNAATNTTTDTPSIFSRLLQMNLIPHTPHQQQQQQSNSSSLKGGGGGTFAATATTAASVERNGHLFCNLPNHIVAAGATAVVAVLYHNTLTIANAGDSRAVLCRNGQAIPLSLDHKPLDALEWSRIAAVGGFVNSMGRVNGNLNLSRSLGDLKYKQIPYVSRSAQVISGEPDISVIELQDDDDDFVVLGCDGIWDCLSNQQVCDFILQRRHQMSWADIGSQLLDSILSVDPRTTQGIGGDNMTILMMDLQSTNRTGTNSMNATNATTTTTTTTTTTHNY